MPARRSAASSESKPEVKPAVNPALPGKEIRKREDVALEIRRLRNEELMETKEIHETLQVSYDVINQLFLQSYKMTMNTGEVFKAQEEIRLGKG